MALPGGQAKLHKCRTCTSVELSRYYQSKQQTLRSVSRKSCHVPLGGGGSIFILKR